MSRRYAISDLLEASANYYVTLLDDYTHGTIVNLVNVHQFESLVSQLETTFHNPDIPPLDIFRILLTLSCRLDEINFAINESVNGPDASKNAMNSSLHYVDMHGARYELRQRSLHILKTYLAMANGDYDNLLLKEKLDFVCKYLYQSVMDFLPDSRFSQQGRAQRSTIDDILVSYRKSADDNHDTDKYDSDSVIKAITENSLSPKRTRFAGVNIPDSFNISRLESPAGSAGGARKTPEPEKHEADLLKRIKVFDDWLVGRKISDLNSGRISKGYWEVMEMTIEYSQRCQITTGITQWEANAFANLYNCYAQFLRLVLDIVVVNLHHKMKKENFNLKSIQSSLLFNKMFPYTKRDSVEAVIRSILVDTNVAQERFKNLRTIFGRDRHYIEHQIKLCGIILEQPQWNAQDVKVDAMKLVFGHILVLYYYHTLVKDDPHSPFKSVVSIISGMLLKLSAEDFEHFFSCAIGATRHELHFVPGHCVVEFIKEVILEGKLAISNLITVDDELQAWEVVEDFTSFIARIELGDDVDEFKHKLRLLTIMATIRTTIADDSEGDKLRTAVQEYNRRMKQASEEVAGWEELLLDIDLHQYKD